MSGNLEKLELRKVVDGKLQSLYVEVAFNPTNIKEEQEIRLRDEKVIGSVSLAKEFSSLPTSIINFDFTLDATGANQAAGEKIIDILDNVKKIREITYEYDGKNHQPPWVEVSWGPNVVRGRTTNLDIEYTLFKPTGEPLRALVSITIERSLMAAEETRIKNMNSPDLTHIVLVKAGDTLPLLCQRVYGDQRYYLDIVKHNNLANFRNLVPGIELQFPPLR